MDLWMQAEYFRFVAPSLFLMIVFLILLAAAVLITYKLTRKNILRNIHLHLDENTREQITVWRTRIEHLETENDRLIRKSNALLAMNRSAVNALSGSMGKEKEVKK